MRVVVLSLALFAASAHSEERQMFTAAQLTNCESYSEEIVTYNEMKLDGAPLDVVLKIYQTTEHTEELTEADVKEIYATNGIKSMYLGGYYKARCLNKVVGFKAPPLETLKDSYAECDSREKPWDVLNCATEVTARRSTKVK